jgi:DeoR/GlpR family transcriptional regulator of sugar metabolism
MLGVERRNKILEKLKEQGSATVVELSELFNVSLETIRRDLQLMDKEKRLEKTYGGAYLIGGVHVDIPVFIREVSYLKGKEQIGEICADLIENGDTIILDSSTTSLHIAESIKEKKNIIVVTNAIKIALKLAGVKGIKVISTGGTLRSNSLSFVGHTASNTLSKFFADKAFVSCAGVDINNGITDSSEREAEIRAKMFEQAKRKILIADYTKFDHTSFAHIANLEKIDCIVTNKPLREEWEKEFLLRNISYLFSQENVEDTNNKK